jgi:hypothetical protein
MLDLAAFGSPLGIPTRRFASLARRSETARGAVHEVVKNL